MNPPEYLTTEQAALYLGVKPEHLRDLRSKGSGPTFTKIGERLVRYRRDWLDSYASSRAANSTIADTTGEYPGSRKTTRRRNVQEPQP